jgi:hypothetical protein
MMDDGDGMENEVKDKRIINKLQFKAGKYSNQTSMDTFVSYTVQL